ncbi:MAG: glycolate oxidase subunit GlcF [Roseiarcus sp.]|uniref:glycolate oxidase subunit GlcF n=1 Tax=Roseiarcus sp. TaxID=1969460 RepID=UPI003C58E0D8
MQTQFSAEALADPHTRELEGILRSCVHCGLCTATCPTYVTLGDERDSPRGRIYLIKDLLETGRKIGPEDVAPIDHCLSCLSCMTTCPSGVDYRRLVDAARVQIHDSYRRPFFDAALRSLLVRLLPSPGAFRAALRLASIGRVFRPVVRRLPGLGPRLDAMLALAPRSLPAMAIGQTPGVFSPGAQTGAPRRMALLTGCAQSVLAPQINAAAIRLLNRAGVEVVIAKGEGCCGSLAHHMGAEKRALAQARADIDAWTREIEGEGLDAIVVTASGCGATIKDYGYMLRDDPLYAEKARRVASLARDVSEILPGLKLDYSPPRPLIVAYHAACSLQHGQKIVDAPKSLLRRAGFDARSIPEAHLCCGSAGTYNILQPEIANALRDRKVANIARVKPDVIAAGNIGCIAQIASATSTPVVHTVELLDWASGGPAPAGLISSTD